MKYLPYLLAVILLTSCDPRARLSLRNPSIEYTYQDEPDNFFPEMAYGVVSDTVYLDAMINDCGEWGGPKDHFALYRDTTGTYKLNCIRYRFSCDSIPFYYGKPKPLEYNKTIVLGAAGKQAVADLFTNILSAKMSEVLVSDSGNSFFLHNNDSTLSVKVFSGRYIVEQNYYRFKKQIGLPENNNRAKYQPEYEPID